jgi:hypothetical protein
MKFKIYDFKLQIVVFGISLYAQCSILKSEIYNPISAILDTSFLQLNFNATQKLQKRMISPYVAASE